MRNTIGMIIVALVAAPGLLSAGENQKFTFGSGLLGYYQEIVPPQVRCVGGEPTGTVPQCTAGTIRIFGRAEQQVWLTDSVSPPAVQGLLAGPVTFEVNCNFNAQYRGPCWGSFRWDVPGKGGAWEGQWTAPVMDLITYESELNLIGFGAGGELEGKQLKVDGHSNPGDWYVSFTARIKD